MIIHYKLACWVLYHHAEIVEQLYILEGVLRNV